MTSGASIWNVFSSEAEQVLELVNRSWRIFCVCALHVDCIHIVMLRKAVDAPQNDRSVRVCYRVVICFSLGR